MKLKSPTFSHQMYIPTEFTCDGKNISPPLSWEDYPENTQSFAIIVNDPDAPGGSFIHWIIYNIPSFVNSMPENIPREPYLSNSSRQGKNDFGDIGYGGPRPPSGVHRYVFTLYALDCLLEMNPGHSYEEIMPDLNNHVLETAILIGRYNRL